ncbi:MAG: NHL repeat-containing protein [Phycisphaerae bacterium]|nr:NHL repeat-containing protein [Phycisphaerae bacterium]
MAAILRARTAAVVRVYIWGCALLIIAAFPRAAAAERTEVCPVFGTFDRQFDGFELPTCIATAVDGRVAVLERDARRVRILNANGEEQLRIDTRAGGDGGPWMVALSENDPAPGALAFAADGRLAIVSARRIAVFDATGTPWRALSSVDLLDPVAATWRGADELWVADRGGRAVVVFGPDLTVQRRIEMDLQRPGGIVAAPDGSVFISDEDAHAILQVDAMGTLIRRFGERGAFPGLFNVPSGLAVTDECLFVADELNHRVAIHRFDGTFVGQWGMHAVVPREGEGKIHYPRSIALAADGASMWVAEPLERRLQRFTQSATDALPAPMPSFSGIQSHFGGAVASDGDLLILEEPESASVFVFDLRQPTPIHVATFGGHGRKLDALGRVTALTVDAETQQIWVADAGNQRLTLFGLARDRAAPLKLDAFMPRLVRSFDMRAWSAAVRALAGAPASDVVLEIGGLARVGTSVWAIDRHAGFLIEFGSSLAPRRAMATGLRGATSLAVMKDGSFVTTLPELGELVEIAADGTVVRRSRGTEDQPFVRPSAVARIGAVEAGDRFVVTDIGADRVVTVDRSLVPIRATGRRGVSDGDFWMPDGVALLAPDVGGGVLAEAKNRTRFVVIDRGNHRAQVFSDGGEATGWIMTFGLGRAYTRPRERGES